MDHSNLMGDLADFIDFLEASAASYDIGYKDEVIRQSAVIRILVDDTAYTTSLLTKLGRKGIDFFDSLQSDDYKSSFPFTGLLGMVETDSTPANLPVLDDGPSEGHTRFEQWWAAIVLENEQGRQYSRCDIVNELSNQKEASNTDPTQDAVFADLKRKDPLGWPAVGENEPDSLKEVLLRPSMRQITHEVLKTIKLDYICHRNPDGSTTHEEKIDFDFTGDTAFPPSRLENTVSTNRIKVGRNDPCPCGSGKKYKKCCMIN